MRFKLLFPALLAALCAAPSPAQEQRSTLDLFLGYSWTHVSPANSYNLGTFSLNGGDVSVSYKFNRWLAVAGDFNMSAMGPHDSNIIGIQLHGTQTTYLFGPRVPLPQFGRFRPFGEALFGVAHATQPLYAAPSSQTYFAYALGGGFDYRLTDSIHLRPIQADYLRTNFAELNYSTQHQNDVRLLTGVVLRF